MEDDAKLFKRIINLRVGEGLIFCPSAIIPSAFLSESPFASEMSYGYDGEDSGSGSSATQEKLGGRFLRVKIRKRLTADVGAPEYSLLKERLLTVMWRIGRKVDRFGVIHLALLWDMGGLSGALAMWF